MRAEAHGLASAWLEVMLRDNNAATLSWNDSATVAEVVHGDDAPAVEPEIVAQAE